MGIDEATEALRTGFKATKTATSLVKARNQALRDAIETLSGGTTQQFTGEFTKAYGRQKLKSQIGNRALSTAVQLPIYYAIAKLLGLGGGGGQ